MPRERLPAVPEREQRSIIQLLTEGLDPNDGAVALKVLFAAALKRGLPER